MSQSLSNNDWLTKYLPGQELSKDSFVSEFTFTGSTINRIGQRFFVRSYGCDLINYGGSTYSVPLDIIEKEKSLIRIQRFKSARWVKSVLFFVPPDRRESLLRV